MNPPAPFRRGGPPALALALPVEGEEGEALPRQRRATSPRLACLFPMSSPPTAPPAAPEAPDATVYDYAIIGSGFGGSVSALRLVEKGYRVLMLEKGSELTAADFPKSNWNVKRWLWLP